VAATYFCLFGTIFLVTQHLQVLLGYGTLAAGIRTVPFAVTLLIVANLTPRIVARVGPRLPIVAGSVVVAVSQLFRIATTPDTGYDLIFAGQVLFAAGMGLLIAPATASIMGSLPLGRAGVGSAMNDTARQVGGALGVAVMGSLAAAGYRAELDERLAGTAAPGRVAAGARRSLDAALAVGDGAVADAARASFITGLRWASVVAIVVALVGAAAAWRLLPGGTALASAAGTAAAPASQRAEPPDDQAAA
jgi:Na+/melibiose symporter-like transporter